MTPEEKDKLWLWFESQYKWHRSKGNIKWHKSQARWYLRQLNCVYDFNDIVRRTLFRYRERAVKVIYSSNSLLPKLINENARKTD